MRCCLLLFFCPALFANLDSAFLVCGAAFEVCLEVFCQFFV